MEQSKVVSIWAESKNSKVLLWRGVHTVSRNLPGSNELMEHPERFILLVDAEEKK